MLKNMWKNFIESMLMSPLIKHQANLYLSVQNTKFPNYQQKFLQIKIKNSSSTYSGIQNSRGEIIKAYIKHCKNFDLKITKQGKLFR